MKKANVFIIISVSVFILTMTAYVRAQMGSPDAIAIIKGTSAQSSAISGTVSFKQVGEDLLMSAEVKNVSPGKHGFHIHEKGDCSDEGKAAGGHFNPAGVTHGFLPTDGPEKAHCGDMGNITVDADGTGILELILPNIHLTGDKNNVSGLAVILHEKEDDFGQPTGNAGGRIGCGIITSTQNVPDAMKAEAQPVKNDNMMMEQAAMGSMPEQMNATK